MGKGTRRERQAREIYEDAGYEVYSPQNPKFGDNDLWNLFDLAAIRPDRKPIFVQVKSNSARGIEQWTEAVQELCPFDHVKCHFIVPYDHEGWRLIEVDADGRRTVTDEREMGCKMGMGVMVYLKELMNRDD